MTNIEQLNSLLKFFQIVQVESSEGKLESTEVIKHQKSFKDITKYSDYKLKKLDCNHSLFFSILQDVKSIERFQEVEIQSVKYKLNFFQKIFLKNRKKFLLDKIKEICKYSSWIIVPTFILEFITELPEFEGNNSQIDTIHSGNIKEVAIYVSPDISSKQILFGTYDSFKIIINKNNFDYDLIDRTKIGILDII